MTVYKPIYLEAQATVALSLFLRAGQKPSSALVNKTTNNKTTDVPSVLLTPVSVTTKNMNDTVVKDGFVQASAPVRRLATPQRARPPASPPSATPIRTAGLHPPSVRVQPGAVWSRRLQGEGGNVSTGVESAGAVGRPAAGPVSGHRCSSCAASTSTSDRCRP